MNKNKIKIIVSVIAMLGSVNSFAQNNVTTNFDTTATIESFCSINANDINFGVVALPLTAQSANAKMNVLCSNNTSYKVDIVYGNSGEANVSASDYTLTSSVGMTGWGTEREELRVTKKDQSGTVYMGSLACYFDGTNS